MRRKVVGALATSLLALAVGIPLSASSAPRSPLRDEEVRTRADALLARMIPEEKAGQLSEYFYFSELPPLKKLVDESLDKGGVGALLFVTDPAETNRLQKIATEKTRLKIPLLFGFDVIHGFRTIFPVPLGMAASWDPKMVEEIQASAAAEARAVGIHWAFAPNVDIARDPRWGRIVEGAGEDPYLGAAMAAAQVRGFQGPFLGSPDHLIAGPKHFAGYGASLGGRDYDEVNLSDNELWNVYLPPFKAAIDAGAGNIMAAYMGLNGVPASSNEWLLTTVLRETWGFKGFVVSDSGAVWSLMTQGVAADPQDAAVRAAKSGIDMEMARIPEPATMRALPAALNAGRITETELDNAVRRVLEAKIRMGLFENPYVDERKATTALDNPAHRQLARLAAERSAVLLRNDNGRLPLDRRAIKSMAVIGPLADSERDTLGPWVFKPTNPQAVSVLAGLRAKVGTAVRIDYSEGVRMPPRLHPSPSANLDKQPERPPLDETAEIRRAVTLAQNADVTVLVLGEGQAMIGEAASRSTFELPGRQQELLDAVAATGKPVVLLLMNARPLELEQTKAAAILEIWYPGSEGGNAVANLLFGDAVPGGKLPFTWLRSAAHAPLNYAHLISHKPKDADKRYWNESSEPTFPFGYGLSYTTFEYSTLQVEQSSYAPGESVVVTVVLKNSGTRAGDEVAQLYIHQRLGTSSRPVRELKGFQRVRLEPGETRTLRFTLSPADLRYWSAATRSWIQDESRFDVWLGGNSTASLAANFEIKRP
jgi:beta-glucosidase